MNFDSKASHGCVEQNAALWLCSYAWCVPKWRVTVTDTVNSRNLEFHSPVSGLSRHTEIDQIVPFYKTQGDQLLARTTTAQREGTFGICKAIVATNTPQIWFHRSLPFRASWSPPWLPPCHVSTSLKRGYLRSGKAVSHYSRVAGL